MKNPFKKKSLSGDVEKFIGVGTVQTVKINNIDELLEQLKPQDMVMILKQYLNHVLSIIQKYSGVIIRYEAHEVLAMWPPYHTNPSHAQLAFHASREILHTLSELVPSEKHKAYDIGIFLGSAEIIGDFFGPKNQFQVFGEAMAIVDQLSKASNINGSFILLSQHTTDLLNEPEGLEEIGLINRNNLDDLRIIAYRPVNKAVHRIAENSGTR